LGGSNLLNNLKINKNLATGFLEYIKAPGAYTDFPTS